MLKLIDCIEAVAFDLDGTLVDTAPDLAAAANMMLVILGATALPDHRIPALIGGGVDSFVEGVLGESAGLGAHRGRASRSGGRGADSCPFPVPALLSRGRRRDPDPALTKTAAALFRHLYRQRLFERGRVYPGVIESLQMLQSAAIPVCCITNKESRFTLPLLDAAALRARFVAVLCADRHEDRKPSPNLLIAACAQLDVQPAQLLYVGDSPSDVVAARAAGCRVVAVAYGYNHHLALAEARPDAIVANLTELVSVGMRQQSRARTLRAIS